MNRTVISGICGLFICIMLAAAVAVWFASDQPSSHSPQTGTSFDKTEISQPLIVDVPGQTPEQGARFSDEKGVNDAWLTSATRDILDHFVMLFEDGEAHMWSAFEQYCEPLTHCFELTELFSRYLQYKHALQELDSGYAGLSASEMEQRIYDKQGLHQQFFTLYEAEVLFGAELAWDTNALARRQIVEDPTLSQEDKQALLKAHFQTLPEALKRAVEPTLQLNEVTALIDSNQATFNQLASSFDSETATRLTEMLKQQDNWKQRVTQYLNIRERILARHASDPEFAKEQLKETQEAMFTASETRRLKVFVENPGLLND